MIPTSQKIASRYLRACAPVVIGQRLLAMLRATQLVHLTLHWQARGDSFYGDHLMFEKMYSSVVDEIDVLAEKLVQMHGVNVVAPTPQAIAVAQQISVWAERAVGIELALQAERDIQESLRHARQVLDTSGALSLGLDDLLASIANTHETHLYLLQQRMSGTPKQASVVAPRGYARVDDDEKGFPIFFRGEVGKVGTRMIKRWGREWGVWQWGADGWHRLDDPFLHSQTPQAAADAADDRSWRQAALSSGQPDTGSEAHFFDTPRDKEVREFATSKAVSNDVDVSRRALRDGVGNRAVQDSPPTVEEVLEDTPGSQEFSTLSRYLVQTEHPTHPNVPNGHDEVPKHPVIW